VDFGKKESVTKEEKETKHRYGTVNFEKRKHPRFSVDLPIEYYQIDSSISHTGRALNASEGGLFFNLTEQVEIGQHLKVKLFFTSGSYLNTIEMLAEVAWIDIHLGEVRGDYWCGVKFVDISPEDLNKLKNLLRSFSPP
jgi:c-di-GMP-binding flagellar brake protein YcgR